MPSGQLITAGEIVAVHSEGDRAHRLIEHAAGGGLAPLGSQRPTVVLELQHTREAFATRGLRPVTRGTSSDGMRTVIGNACGSGFDLQAEVTDDTLRVVARYRPHHPTRAANTVLAGRFGLLAGQTLLHYPALWRAGWRGRVPLHAAVCATAGGVVMLAGPGGVGKSTLISRAARDGARTTADNLCVGDGVECFGLAEPLRLDRTEPSQGGPARTTSHGRSVATLPGRVSSLIPDLVVMLERGATSDISEAKSADAARALVTGTYAAGELRRYWQFAATMALATNIGCAHPAIDAVAGAYADRLPCLRVRVGDGEHVSFGQICGGKV
jgi:hypothetical protein